MNALLVHDRRPPEKAPALPAVEDLLRIAIDHAPAAGNDGPERILGPWVPELDLRRDAGRWAAIMASASMCFEVQDEDTSPFHQWERRSPVPPIAQRASLRAVSKAPLALWRIDRIDPDGLVLADATGLAPRWVPDRPVRVADHGALVPLAVGCGLLARIVPVADGGFGVPIALCLPDVAPRAEVTAWLQAAVAAAGGATIEESLATHGSVFARLACVRAWNAAR